MPNDLFGGEAHARASDPQTSHDAAEAVTPGLGAIQQRVEAFAKRQRHGFLDIDLTEALDDLGPSTVRTRRAELVARNVVLDSGRREKPDGATSAHTVWIHRDFVPGAPTVIEPVPPVSGETKAAGKAMAAELAQFATSLRKEGRGMLSGRLEEAADVLRRLSA